MPKVLQLPGRKLMLLGLMVLSLLMLGCETNRPGVTNTVGRFSTTVNATTLRATRAATDVLEEEYKFRILTTTSSAIDGKVEALTAQNSKIWVWIERQTEEYSNVAIRVGAMGDERLSMEILEKIKERSKTLGQRIRESI